jgi:hypothetical protein
LRRHVAGFSSAVDTRVDNALVKALAQAFRWRMILKQGGPAKLDDLAGVKDVNTTCVSRFLRLTTPGTAAGLPTAACPELQSQRFRGWRQAAGA